MSMKFLILAMKAMPRDMASAEFQTLLPPLYAFTPPSISGLAPSLRPLGDPVFGPFLASTKGDSENCRIWWMPDHTLLPPFYLSHGSAKGGGVKRLEFC